MPGCTIVKPLDTIWISAPDKVRSFAVAVNGLCLGFQSINASYLPLGATQTSVWVEDKYGVPRDLSIGYDNTSTYLDPPSRLPPRYFGPIVGRYANRIKNGTFELDNVTYSIDKNEHDGLNTLHGGSVGWDFRPWSVVDWSESSVTFYLQDVGGSMEFPATVEAYVTYTLYNDAVLTIEINATADNETPIMLSSHDWWNLDGYYAYDGQNSSILNHTVYTPDVTSYVATDGILIPTGELPGVEGTPLDFRTARTIGSELDETVDICGTGCTGYDTCFVRDHNGTESTLALELYSPASGIKLSVSSAQHAIQLFTCDAFDGSIPAKASQGGLDGVVYSQYSCTVIEMEDVVDALNNPEWGIDAIYGPDRPYAWSATYNFTIV
ncbi:galactose mutarotase-like protein [Fomitopsis serialis]|uniref:galactose mutarotase-like protein n=1 Tax=Fomitopsis serialis TaxID=139415 RepID=UPI002007D806|nr:galactose mutarotase-like protein [Neoantrodia serialis]KAH9925097.1 galactose mutarotase-like protein [Neoantrodia serialis]